MGIYSGPDAGRLWDCRSRSLLPKIESPLSAKRVLVRVPGLPVPGCGACSQRSHNRAEGEARAHAGRALGCEWDSGAHGRDGRGVPRWFPVTNASVPPL